MADRNRIVPERVNIFDGQRVTEKELDTEQIHNNTLFSNIVLDFHGSGVVDNSPFEETILLDTRSPAASNLSKSDIESGNYDGMGINFDAQPSDITRGCRIEFEIADADIKGRDKTKLLVLGKVFDGVNSDGELVIESIEFSENGKRLSQHYYVNLIAVFFNNFSGGTGQTEEEASKNSLDLISENNGYMVAREAPPLNVYARTDTSSQIESPNFDLNNFITSSTSNTITEEIEDALGASNSINDLYIELDGRGEVTFPKDGSTTVAYGQKFLAEVNNIQRIDMLLSVERDDTQPAGEEFDFSGDIVVGIYKLATETSCPTDAVPEELIGYDPEPTPIVEVSLGQDDFEALGYKLDDISQVVSFNFAGTLIADPNIDPSIDENNFYAFLVSRRGDNRTGSLVLEKGYDKVTKKAEDGVPLTTLEQFGKQTSRYLEFDPNTSSYVDDSESSLWYVVHSDAVEVSDGTAYADNGKAVTIEKTKGFVGDTEISNFVQNITLSTVAEGDRNYVVLSGIQEFFDADVHPVTNNRVFTRIKDAPEISIVDSSGLSKLQEDTVPVLLARVTDENVRFASLISGTFDKPGLISQNFVDVIDPSATLLTSNLVNRILTPDTNCDCNARYRIVKVECLSLMSGDLNNDGQWTSEDLGELLDLTGSAINSSVTEKSILGGELDLLDFIRSDLNLDDSIDGTDVELLEDAIDGYVNFTVPERFRVLRLSLENILDESDNPTIFVDAASTGETLTGTNQINFTTLTENEALIVRPGDTIEVEAISADSGIYKVLTKSIDVNGLDVSVTVSNTDDTSVSFSGSSGFNVTIVSGTRTNLLADNPDLVNVPYESTEYSIEFIEAPFDEQFVNLCDLRRFVSTSFLEEIGADPCACTDDNLCPDEELCEPVYKNQQYLSGDLYIPNGKILTAPNVPYHGDFEYVNIKVPLPAGSINDCALDLYNTFVKAETGSCKTTAGYPAMKYSDGSLVGCNDSGAVTDITRGRVKFSQAIASLCVDAVVDGYVDGYTDLLDTASDTEEGVEFIYENFIDDSFTAYDLWTENAGNDAAITNITHPVGPNNPAIFELMTSADSAAKFGRLDAPAAVQGFSGDFVVDFRATRTTWPSALLSSGRVSFFSTAVISNTDGSTATLKFGWRVDGGGDTKLFYSGVIESAALIVLSTFDFEIDAPDSLGNAVDFRLRRTNDVVSAFYIVPDEIGDAALLAEGQYIRLGSNPDLQPGDGDVDFSFEIEQVNSPNAGETFFARVNETILRTEFFSDDAQTIIPIGRDNATSEIDRLTLTIPLSVPSRTSVTSAVLSLTPAASTTTADLFNIIPLDILNATNLGAIYNIPLNPDVSLMETFSPGSIIAGTPIEIDITNMINGFLNEQGHLPGLIKGLVIEPDSSADSTFTVINEATLEITFENESNGIVFKVGVSIDPSTGIATLNTRNILFDAIRPENRTVLDFGVYLKKSGFANNDLEISASDLERLGIGSCSDPTSIDSEECFFVVGNSGTGQFVSGPFPCNFA